MLVICNGGHRTGSTLAYNIGRLILEARGGQAIGGTDVTPDLIARYAMPDTWGIVKTHFWLPEKTWDSVRIICSYRNPLDVAASLVRKPPPEDEESAFEFLIKQRAVIKTLRGRTGVLFLRYEEMYRNMQLWILPIAGVLGIEIPDDEVVRIQQSLSLDSVIRFCNSLEVGTADAKTQWRHGHVSETCGEPGAWKTVLSPQCVEKIRIEFAHELSPFGQLGVVG